MQSNPLRMAAVALLALGAGGWHASPAQSPGNGGVFVLSIQGAIGPATSEYLSQGIEEAAAADAELLVIEMDTPGGLDTSMREIIQDILSSPVPVASFVYPEGSRAASAGTYILYASHIAAMAPATNLGAATPVALVGEMPGGDEPPPEAEDSASSETGSETDDAAGPAPDADAARRDAFPEPESTSARKAINDAVAYIRSLAELRNRNADWAERAVRASESLSAEAALAQGVIDLTARDLNDLLRQLDGRVIDGDRLSLPESVQITMVEPNWRTRVLAIISNPNIALLLITVGIYGLLLEGYNPGAIVPGVVGVISLLLAAYALQIMPVNYAGLALMLLGLILMIAEFFVPSFGALGIGGVAAFVFGALILFNTNVPGFEVAGSVIGGIAFSGALAMIGTIWLAVRARNRAVVSGIEEMSGMLAEALEDFDRQGQVWVHGERWMARSSLPIRKGQELRVVRVKGLVLQVEPAANVTNEVAA